MTIRTTELNEAYLSVLEDVKSGYYDRNTEVSLLTPNDIPLTFKFDHTMGMKGSWVVTTEDLKVIED